MCVTLIFKKQERVYMVFAAISLIVFIIQLAAVILAFLLRNNIDNDLNKVKATPFRLTHFIIQFYFCLFSI